MPDEELIHPEMDERLKEALRARLSFMPFPDEFSRFHIERGRKALGRFEPDWVVRGVWEWKQEESNETVLMVAIENRSSRILRKARWNGDIDRWEIQTNETGRKAWVRL
jgi:hypothetical protein